MKKLLTLLTFSVFFLGGASLADASVAATVAPTSGAYEVTDEWVLTVTATGDVDDIHRLEIDFDGSSSFVSTDPRKGDFKPLGYSDFSLYTGSDIYGVQETLYTDSGINAEYSEGEFIITFSGNALDAILEQREFSITLALRDSDDAGLWGVDGNDNNNSTIVDSTFTYTITEEPTNVLSLEGFSDRSVREGQERTFNGSLNLTNWSGESFDGELNIKVTGNAAGLTITTLNPYYNPEDSGTGPQHLDITEALFGDGFLAGYCFGSTDSLDDGCDWEGAAGGNTSMSLDLTVRAENRGTYTFTVSDEDERFPDETFTLTVNRRATGGGGGGFAPVQTTTPPQTDSSTSDISESITDLLERAENFDDLSESEQVEVLAGLLSLLATLQAEVARATGIGADFAFDRDLTLESVGEDVRALQVFLGAQGFTVVPAGEETAYFGELTRAALAQYQAANGIEPAEGYFGPITRAHVNSR